MGAIGTADTMRLSLRRPLALAAALAAFLVMAGTAWEASSATAPALPPDGVEVVVELASPPLARLVPVRRTASASHTRAHLSLSSAESRRALARIARDQAALVRRIRALVPSARVWWRYQVVLNGLAVVVPADDVAKLSRLKGVAHVTRSVAYHRAGAVQAGRSAAALHGALASLDTTPSLIGAPALWGSDLAGSGQGIRIAILDDGVEVTHPFFSADGMSAPAGFPRGQTQYTSGKVIVARAFPAPGSAWKYAGQAYDPDNSEHGIHVAGIAAGRANTAATVGGTKRVLSGIAPGAWIGNYKVLATPTPGFGLDGNAPEIAAGIEAAVKDGMDVINLSLGEPEIAPQRDLVVAALTNAAKAGVVPVVAAGNDYDVVGDGSVDSPGNTPAAITVAASTKQGVIADFSSGGPTPVSLQLKPDVTAPGVNIFSSYPTREGTWSSLSGTSMATPVVSGAVALLLQRHPDWTPAQVKGALTGTGGAVFETLAKKQELPPSREGGGLIDLARADRPLVVADPSSLSFGLVAPGKTVTRTVRLADAGGGTGDWLPAYQPVVGGKGVTVGLPPTVTAPGSLTVSVTVAAGAADGTTAGFVLLGGSGGDRRIPFWLRVASPRLGSEPRTALAKPGAYTGDTRGKASLVSEYRYPDSGPALGIPTVLAGPEQVFRVRITGQVANFGVVVTGTAKGAEIYPRVVSAGDENRLTGMAGLPVDLNPYRNDFGSPTPAAGAVRPLPGLYDIVFDTPSRAKAGSFSFRYWVDDVTPPSVRLLTPSLASGRNAKLLLAVTDAGAGVDPAALTVKVDDVSVDTTYDSATGRATATVAGLVPGKHTLSVSAADYQETRNMEDVPGVLPNTRTLTTSFTAS